MAWNHLTNIDKNNSKNNHNNFCLTSCARIYPKPSTIDMKWTLIKDLGKACCNLQSKNKWVIKMSSFRGVASVLQGGGSKKNVSRGYSPDWHVYLQAAFYSVWWQKKTLKGTAAWQFWTRITFVRLPTETLRDLSFFKFSQPLIRLLG